MTEKKKRKELVESYGGSAANTGSTASQVALLNERIKELVGHFDKNPKDFCSKRGFLKLVGQRKRLLNYLKKSSPKTYSEVTKKLELA